MGSPPSSQGPYFHAYPVDCCINCGFLTVFRLRDSDNLARFPEVTENVRGNARDFFWMEPVCFVNAADPPLMLEKQQLTEVAEGVQLPPERSGEAVEAVLIRDRKCKASTIWRPGYTPREHRELVDRKWVMAREDHRDKEMREREDARDATTARFHKEEIDTLKSQHRWQLIIFGALVTLAVVVSTLVGSMIQAGWISKPW